MWKTQNEYWFSGAFKMGIVQIFEIYSPVRQKTVFTFFVTGEKMI